MKHKKVVFLCFTGERKGQAKRKKGVLHFFLAEQTSRQTEYNLMIISQRLKHWKMQIVSSWALFKQLLPSQMPCLGWWGCGHENLCALHINTRWIYYDHVMPVKTVHSKWISAAMDNSKCPVNPSADHFRWEVPMHLHSLFLIQVKLYTQTFLL